MPAISVRMGTEYACNLGLKGDQIWFPSLSILQAYLVPTLVDITGIIGPPDNQYSVDFLRVMKR